MPKGTILPLPADSNRGLHEWEQIRTGDLTIESPWSYPLSHNSSPINSAINKSPLKKGLWPRYRYCILSVHGSFIIVEFLVSISISIYSASHKKGNMTSSYAMLHICALGTITVRWFHQKRLSHFYTKFSLWPLDPLLDTSYKILLAMLMISSTDHFWMVDVKEWFANRHEEFKGLTGSATLSEYIYSFTLKQLKDLFRLVTVSNLRSSLLFIVSYLLRLLILTCWLASLNLGSFATPCSHYSAQIVFDMHEFKLFPFIHALRYHYWNVWMYAIWKKRKCSMINVKHHSSVSILRGNEVYILTV